RRGLDVGEFGDLADAEPGEPVTFEHDEGHRNEFFAARDRRGVQHHPTSVAACHPNGAHMTVGVVHYSQARPHGGGMRRIIYRAAVLPHRLGATMLDSVILAATGDTGIPSFLVPAIAVAITAVIMTVVMN